MDGETRTLVERLGYLRDVAYDKTSNLLWVATNSDPGKIARIDPATGQVQATITLMTLAAARRRTAPASNSWKPGESRRAQ